MYHRVIRTVTKSNMFCSVLLFKIIVIHPRFAVKRDKSSSTNVMHTANNITIRGETVILYFASRIRYEERDIG